jgi:hypothetical protein
MRVSTRLKTLVRPIHKEGWPVAATLCGILVDVSDACFETCGDACWFQSVGEVWAG